MAEQSDFLDALGVTVNGVPLDNAVTPPPAGAPSPAGTNNYLHSQRYVSELSEAGPSPTAVTQATFDGRAVDDGFAAQHNEAVDAAAWGRRSEDDEDNDDDDTESTDSAWNRRVGPQRILLGWGDDDGLDEGDSNSESENSLFDYDEGVILYEYANPEKILCQSDQEFPVKGYLFLVKWQRCSILRSSWEWEYTHGEKALGCFLQLGRPLRDEWEERKQRQARGEEQRFDVVKWKKNVEEEERMRKGKRVLRRWRRRLVAIRRVMEAEKEDAEADFPPDMIRRIEKEDREVAERKEREERTEEANKKEQ